MSGVSWAQRSIKKAKWRLFYPNLSTMHARFQAERDEEELKGLVCQLVIDQGQAHSLDKLKSELDTLTAWQHLVLFMSEGLFGQVFTREQIAELTGASMGNIHATCGSVKLIRACRVLH